MFCHYFVLYYHCISFVLLQMCDIGDASRGSLSSYAYTLMVLFFLQQRNPPVIPVLQEVQKMFRKFVLIQIVIYQILICECCMPKWHYI